MRGCVLENIYGGFAIIHPYARILVNIFTRFFLRRGPLAETVWSVGRSTLLLSSVMFLSLLSGIPPFQDVKGPVVLFRCAGQVPPG